MRNWQSGLCAFVSVAWMACVTIVFFFPTTEHTNSKDMNYTVVVLGSVLLLSLVWYYFPVYGGVHWFEGPVPNVNGYVARKWAKPGDVNGFSDAVEMAKQDTDSYINNEVALSK